MFFFMPPGGEVRFVNVRYASNSGHLRLRFDCPLCAKSDSAGRLHSSAVTICGFPQKVMSALPPKADEHGRGRIVRFVPIALLRTDKARRRFWLLDPNVKLLRLMLAAQNEAAYPIQIGTCRPISTS